MSAPARMIGTTCPDGPGGRDCHCCGQAPGDGRTKARDWTNPADAEDAAIRLADTPLVWRVESIPFGSTLTVGEAMYGGEPMTAAQFTRRLYDDADGWINVVEDIDDPTHAISWPDSGTGHAFETSYRGSVPGNH